MSHCIDVVLFCHYNMNEYEKTGEMKYGSLTSQS